MLIQLLGATTFTQATTIQVVVMVPTAERTLTVLVAVAGKYIVKTTHNATKVMRLLGTGGWLFGQHSVSSSASYVLPWDVGDIWGCVPLPIDITVIIQAMIIIMSTMLSSLPSLYNHRLSMLLIHRWGRQLQATRNLPVDPTISHNLNNNTQSVLQLQCHTQQVSNPCPNSTSSNLPTTILGMMKVNL